MTTLTIKMPDQLSYRLRRAAEKRGASCSVLVRQAIEDMVEGNQQSGQLTVFALAGDLAGTLDGPVDLSVNPKHMNGFGT